MTISRSLSDFSISTRLSSRTEFAGLHSKPITTLPPQTLEAHVRSENITFTDTTKPGYSELIDSTGFCSFAEESNRMILDPKSDYYRRGYLVVVEGVVLGHIKFKGNRTFLAWRSAENAFGSAILFGGLYDVDSEHLKELRLRQTIPAGNWGVYVTTSLSLTPGKIAGESIRNVLFGTTFRELIRRERSCVEKNISKYV